MAHVNMHQYTSRADLGEMLAEYGRQRRDIAQRERESVRKAGVELQTNRSRLDTELEIAKLQRNNNIRLARLKAGTDLQMKQMGVDLELTLQKMRNMNNEQIELLRRETQRMLEVLSDKNKQAQIIQTYRTQLKLAGYNAKTAMLRTFNEVMGDIYKTGDPVNNAVDAAAYGLWVFAFRKALNMFGLNELMEEVQEKDPNSQFNGEIVSLNSKEEQDEFERQVQEILERGGKPKEPLGKVTRYPKIGFRTKIKMFENQRAGREKR